MIKKICLVIVFFACLHSAAAQLPLSDSLHTPLAITFTGFSGDTAVALNGLRSELAGILPNTKYRRMTPSCKIVFYEPDNSLHPLYAVNPSLPVLPASVEKLFTTSATLWALGSSYLFTTKLDIAAPAHIQDGSVIGNVFLRPSGDPTLRLKDFDTLAYALAAKGIRQIEGDIIGDLSDDDILTPDAKKYFAEHSDAAEKLIADSLGGDIPALDSASSDEQTDAANDDLADEVTEPGFLSSSPNFFIDRNVISIRVTGGDRKGRGVHVSVNPPLPNLHIINRGSTSNPMRVSSKRVRVGRGRKARYRTVRVRTRAIFTLHVNSAGGPSDPVQNITISGLIPAHATRIYNVPIRNVPLAMAALLKWRLEQNGIHVTGTARTGKLPSAKMQLTTLAAKQTPLLDLLKQTNKRSDNFLAESMFRKLSSISDVTAHDPAERSRKLIKSWLSVIRCVNGVCYDGSGLSRSNQTSANAVIDLLHGIRIRPMMYNDFLSTMSIAGFDGTTRARMIGTPAQFNARSKTGTLNGVTALAGFVSTQDGQLASYFITMQNFGGGAANYKGMQNQIVEKLAGFRYADYIAKYTPPSSIPIPPSVPKVTAPDSGKLR
ncbi:MAG: D-alanyl-D-alanine carboxypeptidase/D-alanyl-D-alanine-endopeptidase [Bacteroidota bacterium]|nr:D-alanyl-D-alanine carboxypeptidase/D-alanyl-D-alanine-endopeptidase [Bacteroidota bacterium]MDP4236351.1 D-alanyl-D-alanine carboxypeptidase/D-alanyl-D-alanine-endopeptidase [Bacteroidota bacterium]